jgi:hypothetical protein
MDEPRDDPPGLRETEITLRNAMCDEAADGIDLDMHARNVAAVVTAARRRGLAEASEVTSDEAMTAKDIIARKDTATRMELERAHRRRQRLTGS